MEDEKLLKEKINNILEKYKDKPIYPKLKKVANSFLECHPFPTTRIIYEKIAKLTTLINFNCDFKDGKCKRTLAYDNKRCCCSNCAKFVGHFKIRFFNSYDTKSYIEKELLYYTKKYKISNGFWRNKNGCILPRERRSPTCLAHNCCEFDKFPSQEQLVIELLYDFNNKGKFFNEHIFLSIIDILQDYFLYKKVVK